MHASANQLSRWWQKTTIYQVYPRSFADSNGDGIGDIKGIISRLDHIKELGFETIWFSPMYSSPQKDHGYDVSDYYSISPDFGTMKDAEDLIEEVHKRNMKIVFDMVLNHTSDEHSWFRESKSGRDNPKRNWYIWKPGKSGKKPPNNWASIINRCGWQYDEKTDEWYFASFLPFQPDLNYNNPEVKQAMLDTIKFWLDKGVDGFRLDIFHSIFKDDRFRDNPFSFQYFPKENNHDAFFQKKIYTINHPDNFKLAKEIRKILNSYAPDRFSVGEVAGEDPVIKKYLGENHDGLNLIFLFESLLFKFKAGFFKKLIRKIEEIYPYPYIPTYVFGNHDQKRYISKIENDHEKAKLIPLFQFTVRGIPVTYNGEEIGIKNSKITFRESQDPLAGMYKWIPQGFADIVGLSDLIIRDRARTPMQWDDSPNAGFCPENVKPWLAVGDDYKKVNAKSELADPGSLLNVYKNVIKIRNSSDALKEGSLRLMDGPETDNDLLVYIREFNNEKKLIILNFGEKERVFNNDTGCVNLIYSTDSRSRITQNKVTVSPCSGLILSS